MKNTSSKYMTFVKLFVITLIIFVIVVALCDFAPSQQTQELVIPFTR